MKRFIQGKSFQDTMQEIHGVPLNASSNLNDSLLCSYNNMHQNEKYLPTSSWLWILFVVSILVSMISGVLTMFYIKKKQKQYKNMFTVEMAEQYEEEEELVGSKHSD